MNDNQFGIIQCHACGEQYQVEQSALSRINTHYNCKCGHIIHISFFTYCPTCKIIVGIDSGIHSYKDLASKTTHKLMNNFNPLRLRIRGIVSKEKKIPLADDGLCMLCNTRLARCPYCHNAVEIEDLKEEDVNYFCTECGHKFRLE